MKVARAVALVAAALSLPALVFIISQRIAHPFE
jgi:hypothetical protein